MDAYVTEGPISSEFDELHEALFRVGEKRLENTPTAVVRRIASFIDKIPHEGPIFDLGCGNGGTAAFSLCKCLDLKNFSILFGDVFDFEIEEESLYLLVNPFDEAATLKLVEKILCSTGTGVVSVSKSSSYLLGTSRRPFLLDPSYIQIACWMS